MSKYLNIPPEIARKLDESLSRVRRILALRGILATLAVLTASVLAIMAIDAMVTIYDAWIRWLLWSAGLAGTGAVAWVSLLKPLSRRFTAAEIAALIERNHPELEERLSTVVELAQIGDMDSSERLMSEITRDAVRDAGTVSPKKEFTARTVKPRLIAAALALSVLGALFAFFPDATLRLATRALMPAAEVDNIYASSLKVTPGDRVMLAGSSLTVNLAVEGGFPGRAFVRTRPEGEGESVERMNRITEEDAEGPVFYQFNYPQVAKSFSYRMSCGSALTRAYRVEVVPEPAYSERKIEIVHPEYTGRSPSQYTNSATIVGIAGSRVKISARPARAGIEGEIRLAGGKTVPSVAGEDGRIEFSFDLDKSVEGSWSANLWDVHGFSNQVDSASITVVKDTPPEVKLLSPEEAEVKLSKTGMLPLEYAVKDDFGLSRTVLEMCVGAGAWEDSETFAPEKNGDVTWFGSDVVHLLTKEIGDAGVVRFRIRAEDNLPAALGGPGVAYSGEVMVTISSSAGASSLERQSLKEQIDAGKKDIEDIASHLRRAQKAFRGSAEGFRNAEKNNWHRNEANRRIESARASMRNAEGLMTEMIARFMDSKLETGAEIFRPVLEKHIVPIRQGSEDVPMMARWNEKSAACSALDKDVDEALKALKEAQRKFDILTRKVEDLQRLEDLAAREKALAELAKEEQIDAETFAKLEEELAKEFAEEIKDDLERNLDKEKEKAKELSEKTEELKKRQEEIARQSEEAAKSGSEEEKKAAAEAEAKLAEDAAKLAEETEKLAREIEEKAGPVEADANRTAENAEKAQESQAEAAEKASDASEQMKNGEMENSRQNTDAAEKSLSEAQESLSALQQAIDAKNKEFADNAAELNEMMDALNEAVEAAKEAAEAAAAAERQESESQGEGEQSGEMQPSEMQEGQQSGEQQQGEMQEGQQQSGEQQQGEMQEGQQQSGEQQQGQQQQGEQQNGEQQQGEQQQGQQQNGEQQQGQQQEGQQQNGEQQQGEQQQGQQQQGQQQQGQQQPQQQQGQQQQQGPQSPQQQAMQNAQQKAQQAAQMMQQQVQQQAQQSNMSPEQFQGMESQMPPMPGQQPAGKPGKNLSNAPTPKNRKFSRNAFSDDPDAELDWFKMKSDSTTGADADPLADVPAEYRGLVREYFKALNDGGKK